MNQKMIIGTIGQGKQNGRQRNQIHSKDSNESFESSTCTIRSDKAIAAGWTFTHEPPEPKKCEFCGRALYHNGGFWPGKKHVVLWFDNPEKCDCEASIEHRKKLNRKRKIEAEQAQKKIEMSKMQRKIDQLNIESGIKGRFRNRTFDKFEVTQENRKAYELAKRYADVFSDMVPKTDNGQVEPPKNERNGLFITGSYGTGKTHLAAAIANQLIHNGTPVICMTMIDLLERVKETFDRKSDKTESQIMHVYETIPLLIIDDIGSEQPTEWGASKIFAIINARYESYAPTIVTTNYIGTELVKRMTPVDKKGWLCDSKNAEKSLDRLKEMCVGIEMNWESWRSR